MNCHKILQRIAVLETKLLAGLPKQTEHTFTFTFNHLADAFIQSDVQMRRTIEAIRQSREQQYASAMTSLS